MRPLTVSTKKSRRLRAIEKPLEDDCVAVAKELGFQMLKADGNAGWPDRYVGGGRWIEFKATGFYHHAYLYPLLNEDQRVMCRTLHEMGENVMICVLLIDTRENMKYVVWMAYPDFVLLKQKSLTREELLRLSFTYDNFVNGIFPAWLRHA
jgi:hypothetical protein